MGQSAEVSRRQRHLDSPSPPNGDIYFYSPEQLDGTKGIPGQQNLYDYRDGAVHYVTTFSPESAVRRTIGSQSCSRGPVARIDVSPDGTHMAFLTASRLTSYDNAGHLEMYSYTPATGNPLRLL